LGLIALLHRLGLEYHKPDVIPRKLDEAKQKAFIEAYEKLLNHLGPDEAVAVRRRRASYPCGAAGRLLGRDGRNSRSSRRVAISASTVTARLIRYRIHERRRARCPAQAD
jgi:hypothetical protein